MLARPLCLSVLATFSSPLLAIGQPDTTFGGDGSVVIDFGQGPFEFDEMNDGLIDAAGRYVGAGKAQDGPDVPTVMRVLRNGQRDPGFGTDGLARAPRMQGFIAQEFTSIAQQADGKLVAAGRAGSSGLPDSIGRARVCRFLESGALDPAFGEGGCASPNFAPDSSRDSVVDVALQADGRIVLLGRTDVDNDAGLLEWVVVRLDTDGSHDGCFGDPTCQNGGVVIQPEPPADLSSFDPQALAVAQDQKLIVVGQALDPDSQMGIVRLLPTGAVDTGFGDGGHRTVGLDLGGSDFDFARDVLVRADNSIVVVGESGTAFGTLAAVVAVNAFGTPIAGFGDQGMQVINFNDVAFEHVATSVTELPDGALIVSGYTDNDPLSGDQNFDDCGTARLLANGQLDASFGFGGVLTLDGNAGSSDYCLGAAANADRVILFGRTHAAGQGVSDSVLFAVEQTRLFRDGFE